MKYLKLFENFNDDDEDIIILMEEYDSGYSLSGNGQFKLYHKCEHINKLDLYFPKNSPIPEKELFYPKNKTIFFNGLYDSIGENYITYHKVMNSELIDVSETDESIKYTFTYSYVFDMKKDDFYKAIKT